jgi:hypothetical protein
MDNDTAAGKETGPKNGRKHTHMPIQEASNDYVRIENVGYDIWQIDEILFKAKISQSDIENIPREVRQAEVRRCFTTPIEIFPKDTPEQDTFLPLPHWFRKCTLTLGLFPPPLEARLIDVANEKFDNTDADIRRLIEKSAEIFKHNLTVYIELKRKWQSRFIIGFECATALSFVIFCIATIARIEGRFEMSIITSVLATAIAVGSLLCYGSVKDNFETQNKLLFDKYYILALQNTANKLSNCIGNRMSSLRQRFEEYVRRIDDLRASGEKVKTEEETSDDGSYKTGQVFLWTQMLMWLPERIAGIEEHLRNIMQCIAYTHAAADLTGFRHAKKIFFYSLPLPFFILAATLGMAGCGLFHLHETVSVFVLLAWCAELMLVGLTICFAVQISRLSYYNPDWNTPPQVFKDCLDTSQWDVSAKFNIYVRIPARVQKAIAEIGHKDGQIGRP